MASCCAPACSQALPVKPQGVWARGSEAWAGSRDLRNLEFVRWGSSGPSSLMERMSTLKSCASVTILLLCGFSLNIDFHQKHHSPIHQLLTAGSYSLLKACSHVACWVEFLSPSLSEGWLGPTGADWPLWWDGDGADGMWSDTHMLMVVICSLIQYKDVILPVQEIPFWRWHLYIGSAPIPKGRGWGREVGM